MVISNLDRLNLAMGNKLYLSEEQYKILLEENGLDYTTNYNPQDNANKLALLRTQLDILNTLANNIDLYRSVETEFSNTTDAYKNLESRIQAVENQISQIPEYEPEVSQITYLYHN